MKDELSKYIEELKHEINIAGLEMEIAKVKIENLQSVIFKLEDLLEKEESNGGQ